MTRTGGSQDDCAEAVARDGFCFVDGARMGAWLGTHGDAPAWQAFARTWETLGPDPYLAEHGRLRRRRFGVWHANAAGIVREPHQPHFQALDYNPLQGGIERWFEPMTDAAANAPPLQATLAFAARFFGALSPGSRRWRMEVHQFRIEASASSPGEPTPEGMHRDGVDYVLVLLVARRNIASGVTGIEGVDGAQLGSFTLERPFDAALVDDRRVLHGVTAVHPWDEAVPAYRDVLVVTLRALPG